MSMEDVFDLAVVIEAVDRFTRPMKSIEASMASAEGRMKTISKTMKNMGNSSADINRVEEALRGLQVDDNFARMASDLERIGHSQEQIDALRQSFNELAAEEQRVNQLHDQMKKWGKVALAGAAVTGGGLLLGDALVKSLEKAGEFQSKMIVIKDVTGATQNQINQLGDSIMNVSTKVSKFNDMTLTGFAQQLASGGFNNIKQVQSLVLPVAQYAEAQQYEGKSSDPTESVKQAIEMAHMFKHYDPKSFTQFLDTFNKYSNMQPGDSTGLYQTLTYLAPTAQRQMGMNESDVMALAAVANRVGLTGSHGGTNAADMILRLIPGLIGGTKPTYTYAGTGKNKHVVSVKYPKALQAMMDLGLADSKGNSKFFKDGHITNLNSMLQTLINASKGKSKEQLTGDYKDIFGIQGGRAASILSDKSTIEQLQGMQKQLGKTKSMEQIQQDISKSPQGQLDLLKSNSMTAQLRFAQALGPLLNPIITKLNKMLSSFLELEKQHPKMMKYVGLFAVMTTGLLLIAGPLTSLIGLFGMAATGMRLAFGSRFVRDGIRGIRDYVSNMRTGSAMARGSFVNSIKAARTAVVDFGKNSLEAAKNAARIAGNKTVSGLKRAGLAMLDFGKNSLSAAKNAGRVSANAAKIAGSTTMKGLKTAGKAMVDFGRVSLTTSKNVLKVSANAAKIATAKTLKVIASAGKAMLSFGKNALIAAANIAKTTAALVANAAKTVILRTVQFTVMAATKAWTAIQTVFDAVMIANPIGLIIAGIIALIAIIVLVITHWKQVIKVVQEVWGYMKQFGKYIGSTFSNIWRDAVGWGSNIVKGLWNGIKSFGGWIGSQIQNFVSSHITGPFKRILGIHSPSTVFMQHGKYIVQGLALGMNNPSEVNKASISLAKAAQSSFTGGRGSTPLTARNSGSQLNDNSSVVVQSGAIVIHQAPGENADELADKVMKKLGRHLRNQGYRSGSKPVNVW